MPPEMEAFLRVRHRWHVVRERSLIGYGVKFAT